MSTRGGVVASVLEGKGVVDGTIKDDAFVAVDSPTADDVANVYVPYPLMRHLSYLYASYPQVQQEVALFH